MSVRAERWAKKLSGDSRKRAYDAQKPQMVRLEAIATRELVKIEIEVKQIVQGQSILHLPYYIIFGKELYRLRNTHTSDTLINEAIILEQKWESRGLDPIYLEYIKNFYIQAYANVRPFRLDISLLDGPHVLS